MLRGEREADSNVLSWRPVGGGTGDTMPHASGRLSPGPKLVALPRRRPLAASG